MQVTGFSEIFFGLALIIFVATPVNYLIMCKKHIAAFNLDFKSGESSFMSIIVPTTNYI